MNVSPTLRLSWRIRALGSHPTKQSGGISSWHRCLHYARQLSTQPRTPPSRFKRLKTLAYLSIGLATVYTADNKWYASSITRTLRTFTTGVLVATDYKVNFRAHPPFANSIADVHARNAGRIYDLLRANGGIYLKIGQAIAMQSAVLPPEFQERFATFFDDAPMNGWDSVRKVIEEDFGKPVEEVFGIGEERGGGVIETRASASASVAQVHWARLPDGREVAVKVQMRRSDSRWDGTCGPSSMLSFPAKRLFPY